MARPAVLVKTGWISYAVNLIEQIAREKGTVTADDLREIADPPETASDYGRAFSVANKRRIITEIGYQKSKSRSRRGGALRVWELHPTQRDDKEFSA